MNWYKQAKINKKADFWNKFIATELLALVPILGYIGWTQTDLFDSFKKNNGNVNAVKEEIEQAQQQEPQEQNTEFPYDRFITRLTVFEGIRPRAYDDGVGNLTIGIGHLIDSESRDIFSQLFGNTVDFNDIVSMRSELTRNQIDVLARHDIDEHLNRARGIFPNLSTYPGYVQMAIVDGVYRGDMGPRTTALINSGEWASAADEYLDHSGYRQSIQRGMSGIQTRMDANRDSFLQYARELNQI